MLVFIQEIDQIEMHNGQIFGAKAKIAGEKLA